MRNILATLPLALLIACTNDGAVVFDSSILDRAETQKVQTEIVQKDFDCVYPKQLECMDSVLLLKEIQGPDYVKVYDKQGIYKGTLVHQGEGPGEIPQLTNDFVSCKEDGTIDVYYNHKIATYDVRKFLQNESEYYRTQSLDKKQLSSYPITNASRLNDRYILQGMTAEMRWGLYDGDSLSIYNHYDQIAEEPYNIPVYLYGSCYAIHPDRLRWVQSTYIGGVLDFFQIQNDRINPVKSLFIYQPVYEAVQQKWVKWNQDTTIGFEQLYPTADYVYTILSGIKGEELKKENPTTPFTNKITVFDWKGNPVKILETDCMLMSLAIDEQAQVGYVVSYEGTEGYSLRKFNL